MTPPPLMEHDTAAFGCACLTLEGGTLYNTDFQCVLIKEYLMCAIVSEIATNKTLKTTLRDLFIYLLA